jgi:uncharacterized protein with HEPN domain
MILAAEKIVRYTHDMDERNFAADDKTRDAVLHNLEIIGRPRSRFQSNSGNGQRALTGARSGLRDIVAHAYFGIDDLIVWDIVLNKVPELIAALNKARTDS